MPKTAAEPGAYLVGEFLGVKEGREYEDRNKEKHTPGIVSLLVGSYVEKIEYPDLATAEAVTADLADRDNAMLAVRPRGPWDTDDRRFGRVSYRGRSD